MLRVEVTAVNHHHLGALVEDAHENVVAHVSARRVDPIGRLGAEPEPLFKSESVTDLKETMGRSALTMVTPESLWLSVTVKLWICWSPTALQKGSIHSIWTPALASGAPLESQVIQAGTSALCVKVKSSTSLPSSATLSWKSPGKEDSVADGIRKLVESETTWPVTWSAAMMAALSCPRISFHCTGLEAVVFTMSLWSSPSPSTLRTTATKQSRKSMRRCFACSLMVDDERLI